MKRGKQINSSIIKSAAKTGAGLGGAMLGGVNLKTKKIKKSPKPMSKIKFARPIPPIIKL